MVNHLGKIVVLGGSYDQLAFISKIQEAGYETVVFDANPDCPATRVSTDFYPVSTRNATQIIETLRSSGIWPQGVVLQGSDITPVQSQICEAFGLPHIPMELAKLATDKLAEKRLLERSGIATPKHLEVFKERQIQEFMEHSNSENFILKPRDSSGSKGVFFVDRSTNITSYVNEIQKISEKNTFLVEEFVEGVQISTESLVENGFTKNFISAERNYEQLKVYKPNIIENGGWSDNLLKESVNEEIIETIRLVVKSLGLERGVIKCDLIYDGKRVQVVEFALRASGGDLSETLIPYATGIDFLSLLLDLAIGKELKLESILVNPKFVVANRYFFPSAGTLRSFTVKKPPVPGLIKFNIWKKIGSQMNLPTSHADRIGVFVLCDSTREALHEKISYMYTNFSPRIS